MRSVLIGATRCGVIYENTVLLETQGPCGSVRNCSADTVTYDTSTQVENVTPVTLGVTFAGKKTKKLLSRRWWNQTRRILYLEIRCKVLMEEWKRFRKFAPNTSS